MDMPENKNDLRVSKAAEAYAKRRKKNKTIRTIAIIAAIIIVIGLVILSYFTSGTWYRTRTVLTLNGHDVSCAEFNYYYFTSYNEIYQSLQETYGDSASVLLDPQKPLDEQDYAEGVTWDQHIKENAIANLEQVYTLFYNSIDEGYALSSDKVAELAATVDYVAISAEQYGYTEGQYLQAIYGKGMNRKLYENCAFMMATASDFYTYKTGLMTHTDEEIEAYYNENIQSFDTMNLRIFTFALTDADGNETEAETKANEMLAALTDEQSFIDLAYDYASDTDKATYSEDAATLHSGIAASSLTCEGMAEWFYDESRKNGDTAVFNDDSGYYVVMWLSREDNNYNEVTMRHVLAKFSTEDDGSVTDVAREAAKTLADQYLTEWEGSEKTEDYFATMANTYSGDGDGTTGGLYEGIYKGAMVEPINTWLFDESRKAGDVEVMETEFGYHLVYFVNADGPIYRDQLVADAMKTADMDTWFNAATADYTAVVDEAVYNSGMIA